MMFLHDHMAAEQERNELRREELEALTKSTITFDGGFSLSGLEHNLGGRLDGGSPARSSMAAAATPTTAISPCRREGEIRFAGRGTRFGIGAHADARREAGMERTITTQAFGKTL